MIVRLWVWYRTPLGKWCTRASVTIWFNWVAGKEARSPALHCPLVFRVLRFLHCRVKGRGAAIERVPYTFLIRRGNLSFTIHINYKGWVAVLWGSCELFLFGYLVQEFITLHSASSDNSVQNTRWPRTDQTTHDVWLASIDTNLHFHPPNWCLVLLWGPRAKRLLDSGGTY